MKRDIKLSRSAMVCLLLAAALVALKLIFGKNDFVFLTPYTADIDDMLIYRAAESIVRGEWLGAYGPFTIAKHMFGAVWIALLHVFGVPYLLGGQILYTAAAAFTVWAAAPMLRSNAAKLAAFAALLWSPAAFSNYLARVYRDGLFPSLCLMVFAGLIGAALRYRGRVLAQLPFALVGGAAFAAAWLTREDGLWLVPFAAAASAVTLGYILFDRTVRGKVAKVLVLAVPYMLLFGGILAYSALNYSHYGVFTVSDMNSGPFAEAYGALARIEAPFVDKTPVPEAARQQAYAASESFALIRDNLEGSRTGRWRKGDFQAGGLYWAMREAAAFSGYYADAKIAAAYWQRVADEINRACDIGQLPSTRGKNSSLVPPMREVYVRPFVKELLRSAAFVLTFEDCDPTVRETVYPAAEMRPYEAFLGERANTFTLLPDESRTVVFGWACSLTSMLDIEVQKPDGTPVEARVSWSASDDVYAMFMRSVDDAAYIRNARFTLSADLPFGEPFELIFVNEQGERAVRLFPEAELVSAFDGLTYNIEGWAHDNFILHDHPQNELKNGVLNGVRTICAVALPVGFALALLWLIFASARLVRSLIRRRPQGAHLEIIVLWGLVLSIALRIGMIAFYEVAAFGIGTYVMYLSTVHPLTLLFTALALSAAARELTGRRRAAGEPAGV